MTDKFNMVSLGGIDIIESQGVSVDGLFDRLRSAISRCRYQIIYDWYFAKIPIPPTSVELVLEDNSVSINGIISIDSNDVVHIYSLERQPVITSLSVTENGEYTASDDVDGFSPVNVNVNVTPTILPLQCAENGVYNVQEGVDGFDPVTVNVVPEYQKIAPDFYGLAPAFITSQGQFSSYTIVNQCLFIAHVEYGYKYVVFLPETVDNRFRASQWPGKDISDFSPYLYTPASEQSLVYTGGQMITPSTELAGDGLTRRFFFDGVDGEIIIGTSSIGQLVEPILLKINN